MEILILLSLLQIKHWYADFKIQTYMQTVKKGVWLDLIGVTHTMDHMWCSLTALLIFNFFHYLSPFTMLIVVAIEGITHYLIDFIKVKWGCKDNTSSLYWTQFGLDQLAHQACYILMVAFFMYY